jgi:acetyl-CoA C-acetyltransferase
MVAGGMESMTNAPYLLPKARGGLRLGHGEVKDHMFLDGLEDAYDKGRLMGTFAEDCAGSYKFTREAQDAFAIASTTRAKQANTDGSFAWEIAPVTVSGRKGDVVDRQGRAALQGATGKDPDAEAGLPQGRHGDRRQLLVDLRRRRGAGHDARLDRGEARRSSRSPRRRPQHLRPGTRLFTTAPVGAMKKLLAKNGWSADSVDLWEINEAFAVVTMAAMHDLKLPHDKVNVHGGACALGHPIGASGARVIVTLIGALKKHGKKRGVASLCIGGGEATAVGIELV